MMQIGCELGNFWKILGRKFPEMCSNLSGKFNKFPIRRKYPSLFDLSSVLHVGNFDKMAIITIIALVIG